MEQFTLEGTFTGLKVFKSKPPAVIRDIFR